MLCAISPVIATTMVFCSIVSGTIAVCFFTLTPGVGIGIVDLGYERRLANQLGAHRAPSIIGLVNGRVTFFHQAVVREHLRQFIENLLPQRLVEKVNATEINVLPLFCWKCFMEILDPIRAVQYD